MMLTVTLLVKMLPPGRKPAVSRVACRDHVW